MNTQHTSSQPLTADQVLDDFALRLIRRRAKSLVGKFGFTSSDRLDLEQDLILDLLQRLPKFDPQRLSPHAFVSWIVRNKVRLIVRARKRLKGQKLECDETFDSLCDGAQTRHRGIEREQPTAAWERAEDVRAVLAQMPPELQSICELLKEKPASVVRRELCMTRKAMRTKLQAIREYFVAGNLDAIS
jgi:RNA polymerase sigma-70 factor (ECF subfamily)